MCKSIQNNIPNEIGIQPAKSGDQLVAWGEGIAPERQVDTRKI